MEAQKLACHTARSTMMTMIMVVAAAVAAAAVAVAGAVAARTPYLPISTPSTLRP